MTIKGHRHEVLVGIAAVLAVMLVFAIYKYSGSPEALVGDPATSQSKQIEETAGEGSRITSLSAGEPSTAGDNPRSEQDAHEYETRVSIDVSNAGVLVVAEEATLQEVLDGLVREALVEVVDLRPEDNLAAVAAQVEKQSFRFSGPVDNVLRFVMGQYDLSYAISDSSHTGTQAENPVIKLYLYGTMQGDDTQLADEQRRSPASREAVSTIDRPDDAKNHTIVSDLLRKRAVSAAGQTAPSTSSSTSSQEQTLSGASSPVDRAPLSGTAGDEDMNASIAEMTRRASEQVQALAAELKKAEESLKVQRDNQYGDTGE